MAHSVQPVARMRKLHVVDCSPPAAPVHNFRRAHIVLVIPQEDVAAVAAHCKRRAALRMPDDSFYAAVKKTLLMRDRERAQHVD